MLYYDDPGLKIIHEDIHSRRLKDKINRKLVNLLIGPEHRIMRQDVILGVIGLFKLSPSVDDILKKFGLNDQCQLIITLCILVVSAHYNQKTHYKKKIADAIVDCIESFLQECLLAVRVVDWDTRKKIYRVMHIFRKTRELLLSKIQQFRESSELQPFDYALFD